MDCVINAFKHLDSKFFLLVQRMTLIAWDDCSLLDKLKNKNDSKTSSLSLSSVFDSYVIVAQQLVRIRSANCSCPRSSCREPKINRMGT